MTRRKFHRFIFCAAGIYNIVWGLYSVADPQWLFRYAGLPPQTYPQIFACLGMVVGLYGIIYLEVARIPERGWLLAAVGLVGKVLGPIGLAQLIWSGQWPLATGVLCLTNRIENSRVGNLLVGKGGLLPLKIECHARSNSQFQIGCKRSSLTCKYPNLEQSIRE